MFYSEQLQLEEAGGGGLKDYGYPQYMEGAAVFGGEEREKTGVMECWSIVGIQNCRRLSAYNTADD